MVDCTLSKQKGSIENNQGSSTGSVHPGSGNPNSNRDGNQGTSIGRVYSGYGSRHRGGTQHNASIGGGNMPQVATSSQYDGSSGGKQYN